MHVVNAQITEPKYKSKLLACYRRLKTTPEIGHFDWSVDSSWHRLTSIAISPIVSKVFEHCTINKSEPFFVTSDRQKDMNVALPFVQLDLLLIT